MEQLGVKNLSPVAKGMCSRQTRFHALIWPEGTAKKKILGSGKKIGIYEYSVMAVGSMVRWC
jgi:hypothetical protein